MPDPFKELSNYAFTNAWVPKQRREYSRSANRYAKIEVALRSKVAAKNTFKGTFKYVADFFRYARPEELIAVYEKLMARKGYYIDGAIGINAAENPQLRDTPAAFFRAFEILEKQVISAQRRMLANQPSAKRASARKRLFELIMKYEDVQPSFFINVLFKTLPASYEVQWDRNLSPMTRKTRRPR